MWIHNWKSYIAYDLIYVQQCLTYTYHATDYLLIIVATVAISTLDYFTFDDNFDNFKLPCYA